MANNCCVFFGRIPIKIRKLVKVFKSPLKNRTVLSGKFTGIGRCGWKKIAHKAHSNREL